jgi:hypothetical protein
MVDARQVVMGVLSTGPVQSADWWTGVCHRASTKLIGVSDIGGFLDDGNLQFGIGYRQVAKKGLVRKIFGTRTHITDLQIRCLPKSARCGISRRSWAASAMTQISRPSPHTRIVRNVDSEEGYRH